MPFLRSLKALDRLLNLDKVSYLLETIQKPAWSLRPRIYLVLHIIGLVDLMDNFVDEGILDIHFPFTEARLPAALDDFTSRHKFIETQSVVSYFSVLR